MNAATISELATRAAHAQVVAHVYGQPVTRGELLAQFDRVKDGGNWKNPIDVTLALRGEELALMQEAIIFFTGSVPRFDVAGRNTRVRAPGYFAAIGA